MSEAPARAVLATLLTVIVAAPAAAELLMTRGGQIIETRGGWQVRGKQLVFELPDGTLASLRLEEADLEASERLNLAAAERARRAREAALRPPPGPARATVVITDRDVLPARDLAAQSSPEPGVAVAPDAADAGSPAAAGDVGTGTLEGDEDADRGVQVVEWTQEPDGETGLAIRGVIQNLSPSFATGLSVNTLFYDAAGLLIAAREVRPEGGSLRPGERREFSVAVPDTLIYEEIRFLVLGRGFRPVRQSVRAGGQMPPVAPDGS